MSTAVVPFVRPETPIQVLEDTLEWAKDEKKWVEGILFSPIAKSCPTEKMTGRPCDNVGACLMGIIIAVSFDGPAIIGYSGGEERMPFDPSYMEVPNGETKRFLDHQTVDVDESIVAFYPPAAKATMYLASALNPKMGKFRGTIWEAVERVVHFNDASSGIDLMSKFYEYEGDMRVLHKSSLPFHQWKVLPENMQLLIDLQAKDEYYRSVVPTRFGDVKHHQKIVKAVEDALVLARRDVNG